MKKITILALLFAQIIGIINTKAQTYFGTQQTITTTADNARSVYSSDIDGDGDLDILSASWNDDKIAWNRNIDGNGYFGSSNLVSTIADRALSVYSCDLNGDNDMDVLSASEADDKIAWYKNNGSGGFGSQQVISNVADRACSVYACDIDGDGDMDVLSASYGDHKIAWYKNNGSGSFGSELIISTAASGARSVFACDIDGDGDMDVLSASYSDNKIAWYENTDGKGTFGAQQVITTMANYAQSVYACDIDGDGDMDVLSASPGDNKVAWYENTDGAGTFGTQKVISTSGNYVQSVYACDLDLDGDMDVLAASSLDDKIAWYENIDGAGTFSAQNVITTAADYARSVYACDVDNDGDLDVLTASSNDDRIAWHENFTVKITVQPQNSNISCNSNTNFFLTAQDADAYQWQFREGSGFSDLTNDASYSGVTTSTLQITNATSDMSGYEYRCIVSNAGGDLSSDTVLLIIEDVENPVITSTHNDQSVDASTNYEALLPDYKTDIIATDNCDLYVDTAQNPIAGTIISGSTNLVTLTVTDDAGNFAQVSFNVSVVDNSDPVITSIHNDVNLSDEGSCQAALPDYTGFVTATDNCDVSLDISQNPTAGTAISGSINTVTLTVTDDDGNFAEKSFNVGVDDTTKPVITSTHNTQTLDANTSCEAILPDYTGSLTATDNCDTGLDIVQSPVPGTTISGTTNFVVLKATDDAGNFAEVSFNVEVQDNTKPIITSTHNAQIISSAENCEAILPDYTGDVVATDVCDSELDITQSPEAGSTVFGAINEVTLTATDDAGNYAKVKFNVGIEDNIAPVITSDHNNQTIDANGNCEALLPDYTGDVVANDHCDTELDIVQSPAGGTIITGATNEITISVTDDAGNDSEVTFNVSVEDNNDPAITCAGNQSFDLDPDNSVYTVSGTLLDPVLTTDNCNIESISNDYNASNTLNGAEFLPGNTTVVWTITDGNGNTANCSFDITVNESVGIKNLKKHGISIYPNPTSGVIYIESTKFQIERIEVYDLTGKLLINKSNLKEKVIDLSELSGGMYIINISTEKYNFTTGILKE